MLGDLAELQTAIEDAAHVHLLQENFFPVATPSMFRKMLVEGCGWPTADPQKVRYHYLCCKSSSTSVSKSIPCTKIKSRSMHEGQGK